MRILISIACIAAASVAWCAGSDEQSPHRLDFADVAYMDAAMWRPTSVADARIRYGEARGMQGAVQFGDLRLPDREAPSTGFPVIVFLHGGAWRAEWSKDYTEALVEALSEQGFATWDLEYRRMGHEGGGYPGTFVDIADGLDFLRAVATDHPLDLSNVIAVGHSSGGHLALWLAGRHRLEATSPLHRDNPLPLRGVISIAGVNDLERSLNIGNRTDVLELAGVESLESGRERMDEIDPGRLLPLGVPQRLVIGTRDAEWRLDMTSQYEENARAAGDDVRTILLPGGNHMDVVDARSGVAELLASLAFELIAGEPD